MKKLTDFMILLGYCALIYWLSNQPSLVAPMWFEYQDKVHHAGAYGVMALLVWRNLHFVAQPVMRAVLAVLFCSLFGVSDEWHQSFIEGRSSEVADWIADTGGAMLAIALQSGVAGWHRARMRSSAAH